MSYCPFGTQAEKGILPVINLLKDKIDFKVKFVNYSMHGKKEIEENTLQYCIQKVEPNKYNDYLTCFLKAGNSKDCIKEAKLDMNKINTCIENTKKKFNIE
jgi:homospermidine synthase